MGSSSTGCGGEKCGAFSGMAEAGLDLTVALLLQIIYII